MFFMLDVLSKLQEKGANRNMQGWRQMPGQLRCAHRGGVHVAGPGARAVLQEVRQHVRVVLQDLPVDQVPHLCPAKSARRLGFRVLVAASTTVQLATTAITCSEPACAQCSNGQERI